MRARASSVFAPGTLTILAASIVACGSTDGAPRPGYDPVVGAAVSMGGGQIVTAPSAGSAGSGVDVAFGAAGCTRSRAGASSFSSPLGADKVAVYNSGGQANASDSVNNQGAGGVGTPVVELIFWGSAWNSASTTPSRKNITDAVTALIGSSYFDALGQYGVSHPTLDKVVSTSDYGVQDPPANYQQSDVGFAVWQLAFQGVYGSGVPNQNNVYLVMMPPGTTPPTNVCGEHSTYFTPTFESLNVGWSSFSDLSSMIEDASHELVEQMTDTDGGGWLMDRSFGSGWSEIGDACNGVADTIDGVLAQSYWSNADHACVIPFAPPVLTSMSPTSGSGGTLVTVTGKHLGGGAPAATFDGIASAPTAGPACSGSSQCSFVAPGDSSLSMAVNFYVQSNYTSVCLEDSQGNCVDFHYPCNGALVNGACLQCCATYPGSYDCIPTTQAGGTVTEVWLGSSNCTGGQQPTVAREDPQVCGPVSNPPSCSEACSQTVYLECACPNGEVLGANGNCTIARSAGGGGVPGPVRGPVRLQ